MSIIKPGKLGISSGLRENRVSFSALEPAPAKSREIWDDFQVVKKVKKKREYERGAGNRMIPAQLQNKSTAVNDLDQEGWLNDQGVKTAAYEPRVDYQILEDRLGIVFKDKTLLQRAVTHRSALGLSERADYERLEFLGDAVLDLTVAHLLSDKHPEAREGELSKMRAALVNTQALAAVARNLDIGPFIRLGRGELASGGHDRPSILADVMEAIIGAVYRDSSFEVAFSTIERIFGSALEEVTPSDPKTELQEMLHAAGSEPPTYLLEMVEGPEHAPTFVTVVIVDGEIVGRGRGATKKAAQQEAAAQALARLVPTAPDLQLAEGQDQFIVECLLTTPVLAQVASASA